MQATSCAQLSGATGSRLCRSGIASQRKHARSVVALVGLAHQNRQRHACDKRHASERADREMPTVRADLPIGIFRWRVAQAQHLARESGRGDAAEPQETARRSGAGIALVAFQRGALEFWCP
jgi:hypothetical protein